jgi:hypothetical protein
MNYKELEFYMSQDVETFIKAILYMELKDFEGLNEALVSDCVQIGYRIWLKFDERNAFKIAMNLWHFLNDYYKQRIRQELTKAHIYEFLEKDYI